MNSSNLTIRKTPFHFLQRVALLITLFALAPAIVAALLDLRGEYQASALAAIVPNYTLFLILLLALVQFLMVVVAFTLWYVPVYVVDNRQIVQRGWGLHGDRQLAELAAVDSVVASQSLLGRRLGYGSLVLTGVPPNGKQAALAIVKDIPNPDYFASQINQMAELARARQTTHNPRPATELIAAGEGQFVEFKASLMWDYYRQAVNKDLYEPVMKNLVAFMNTTGGLLLIGVSDEGDVLGLQRDFNALPKKNADGFENAFNQAFNSMIGAEFRQYVSLAFEEIAGAAIAVVAVSPASTPAYLSFKGKEEFYIRTGNSSQPLPMSRAMKYIQTRFAA